ncbi:MAG: 2-oxo acid dehydrogenase subunit E2 [Bacteroidetes bacterium]|nr:2-oxo acid dehydrogenase subunit E2 [Bacteroidota bacterium]HET6243412.1 dihydrolipoamide acetyltransferase family protein [Bacteroidia bacterium]
MAQIELILPKMGESVAEATIIKWLKNEGEHIDADESVLEIATDKVDSEVPSPTQGILIKRMFNEGDVVQVGSVIALIGSKEEVKNEPVTQPEKMTASAVQNSIPAPRHAEISVKEIEIPRTSEGGKFYSPLVRNIAKTEGISTTELEKLHGTGSDGRVTKNDILDYLSKRSNGTNISEPVLEQNGKTSSSQQVSNVQTPQIQQATTSIKHPVVSAGENDEIIEMDRMRKLIADHMVMSKHVAPHVTSFVEVDVTNLVMWREKNKKEFEKREGEKITYTPIFIEAVTRAIKEFPMINIAVSGSNIIKRKNINIGIATALPTGNLIVPVIKNADQMNLVGLTKTVNDLVARARVNKLKPDDIQGGTFTISNVGTFGNVMGTPIINQPQVAILAVGAIRKKPVVIETPQGDTIGIRHMMFLSMSYDHRVVDGMLGGTFIRRVGDLLESFDLNHQF